MADKIFNKEVTRFSLNTKKECLEELIAELFSVKNGSDELHYQEEMYGRGVAETKKTYQTTINKMIEDINEKLQKLDKTKPKSSDKSRKISAYNRFVKIHLPAVAKQFPEMKNNERMTKVSKIWQTLSAEEKQKYAEEVCDEVIQGPTTTKVVHN